MGNIFVSKPGKVVSIPGDFTLPGAVRVQDRERVLNSRVIITGLSYDQASHVQFQHSLLQAIYLYSFGEKMGQVVVSGIAFAETCRDPGGSGAEDVLAYYANNRVSLAHRPVLVLVGRSPINGYLVSSRIQSLSVEHMTYSFQFVIASVPAFLDSPNNTPGTTGGGGGLIGAAAGLLGLGNVSADGGGFR